MPDPSFLEPRGAFDQWMMINGPYVYSGVLSLFGLGMLYIGVLALQESLRMRLVARQMPRYPATPGEVISSQVQVDVSRHRVERFYPAILYRYTVGGRTFESYRILPGEFVPNWDRQWAQQWVDAFPVGREITVYYNPRRPQFSVVERTTAQVPGDEAMTLGIGVVFVLVASWVLWMVATKILPEAGKPLPSDWPAESMESVEPPG